jgi:hypothetical protein
MEFLEFQVNIPSVKAKCLARFITNNSKLKQKLLKMEKKRIICSFILIMLVAMPSFGVALTMLSNPAYSETSVSNFYGNLDKTAQANDLIFSAWGGQDNKMFIREINNETGKIFRIQGTTGSSAAGFACETWDYSSRNITLGVGNVSTFSNDYPLNAENNTQISFRFHLTRQNGEPAEVSYVVGKLYTEEGWNGNHYYKKITPNSSYVFKIPNDAILKGITVGIEEEVTVNPVDFSIKL